MTIEQKLKGKNRLAAALGALGLIVGICLGQTGDSMTYNAGFQAGQQSAWAHQGGAQ
ncbi:hypothetical protein KBX29_03965 [Corynebacterium sp. CCUG 18816]|uniref:hypothetical protein n=1 Tax=Corynebacterium pseudogenitalium TaxID=38303 RepID=UPI00210A3BFA|nr:hypothetical protein [Corynebacterium pseudogenitalium]MCQ4616003.1 hypothetical protein [Corynebacterium pseudogenitalium]